MAIAELNEASTSEEIAAYAEQVAQEVKAERAGETHELAATEEGYPGPKSDAQIASEHANNEHKETSAEEKSGSESAEVDDQGEDTTEVDDGGDDSGEESWITDDLKAEVASYGLDDSELADFASREELDVALRFLDKRALEAGRKALADSEGDSEGQDQNEKGTTRNEKGQFEKKEEPTKADPPAETQESRYEVTLDKDVYDEEVVAEFTRMRDHYEKIRDQDQSRLSALEERFSEVNAYFEDQTASIVEQKFDSAVDALKMPKLFGKTGSESQQELERRQDLMVQAKAQQLGLKQLTGRDVDLDSLVARVAPMVFSDEFDKLKLKTRTRKISKQSNGRQGGGATRPQDPRDDPRDEADRLYRELEGR